MKKRLLLSLPLLAAAAFYFYDPAIRSTPSVMIPNLMQEFNLSTLGIGFVAAFYLYAYNIAQIPSGLIADKFGARRLITGSCLILTIGVLGFALATSYKELLFWRFVMGVGGTSSTVGAMLVLAEWFPAKYFAFLAGVIQLFGTLGNMFTDVPVAYSTHHFGWRFTMLWLCLLGLIITTATWIFLKRKPSTIPAHSEHFSISFRKRLLLVAKSKPTWSVASYGFFIWIPVSAFAGLWGIPYIAARYHITIAHAATLFPAFWLGIAIGSPLIGLWSNYLNRRVFPLFVSAFVGLVTMLLILFISNINQGIMLILLFFLGTAASGQTLSFALIKEHNNKQTTGTAIALNNLAIMLGGSIADPVIGWFLNLNWNGQVGNKIPAYQFADYQHAMYVIPFFYLIACVICLFLLKETYCRPYKKEGLV